MKKELQSKDELILNLKERLLALEDTVSNIQREEKRDKSQQRIKDAIVNIEKKLELFSKERDINTLKLKEMSRLSSELPSSRDLHSKRS